MSTDPEHKFELALQLGEVKIAYQLALEAEVGRPIRLHTKQESIVLAGHCNYIYEQLLFALSCILH